MDFRKKLLFKCYDMNSLPPSLPHSPVSLTPSLSLPSSLHAPLLPSLYLYSHSRDWRYHLVSHTHTAQTTPTNDKPHLPHQTGMRPVKQEQTFEEGLYFYFDMNLWRKAVKEFRVDYDKLEDRPPLPSSPHAGGLMAAS